MDINIPIDVPDEQLVDILRQREINSKPEKIEYWIDPKSYSYSLHNKRLQIKMPLVYCVNEKNFRCAPNLCIYIGEDKNIGKITIGKTKKTKDLNSFAKLLTSDNQLLRSLVGKILQGSLPPAVIDFDPTKYFSSLQEIDSVIDNLYPELSYTRQNRNIHLNPKGASRIRLRLNFSIRTQSKDQILKFLDNSNKLLENIKKTAGNLFDTLTQNLEIFSTLSNNTFWFIWLENDYQTNKSQFRFIIPSIHTHNWEDAFLRIKGCLITLQTAYDLIKQVNPKRVKHNFRLYIYDSSPNTLTYNEYRFPRVNLSFDLSKQEGIKEFKNFLKNIK